jgi:hypothetical protein
MTNFDVGTQRGSLHGLKLRDGFGDTRWSFKEAIRSQNHDHSIIRPCSLIGAAKYVLDEVLCVSHLNLYSYVASQIVPGPRYWTP